MAAQQDVDIDAMDWGPGVIEIGTQEAEEAMTALVSAAVKVDGAPAGPSTETKVEQLWRCGTLRSTSPSAMPLLKLAVKHADERYVLRELHCAQCCGADTAPFVHLHADGGTKPLDRQAQLTSARRLLGLLPDQEV